LTAAGLRFRREHADLFQNGGYLPVEAAGIQTAHVVSFLRRSGTEHVLVVVPRLVATLMIRETSFPVGEDIWGDTVVMLPHSLRDRTWTHIFTGNVNSPQEQNGRWVLPVKEILNDFPVAILSSVKRD
jgi:(1->4)-alpha-D-glucan 1-alpha-D-glucosylmutase